MQTEAGPGASIMTAEGRRRVMGGLIFRQRRSLGPETSSGLLLQPPCPSQEALPWRQRGLAKYCSSWNAGYALRAGQARCLAAALLFSPWGQVWGMTWTEEGDSSTRRTL